MGVSNREILTIVGARPQFIKAAVVSKAMAAHGLKETLVHTGQHFDQGMSDIFFEELEMRKPDYNLGIHSLSHGAMTARMLEGIEKLLDERRPAAVLVYGDTNSTLAGALAASKMHIPVAHVEAGLRSFNKKMPEEINRILTDHVSDILFTPTSTANQNLGREGIDQNKVHLVGDVMYDAALHYLKKAKDSSDVLTQHRVQDKYYLATIHRAENTDNEPALRRIFTSLHELARDMPVVLPLHPRTRQRLTSFGIPLNGITAIEPVGYLDMMMLEAHAHAIITDSGGIQKEAFFHKVPCITLRDETEWTELVDAGWNLLVSPTGEADIATQVREQSVRRGEDVALYGVGDASEKIAGVLKQLLNRDQ